MAALRNGIKTVIILAENGRDLDEIDQTVRKALRFVLVDQAEQVLAEALCCLERRCGRPSGRWTGSCPERSPGHGPAAPVRRGAYVHQCAEGGVHPLRCLPKDFRRDALPQVAFAGRSNVGKSSVINRLLNRKKFCPVGGGSRQDHPDQLF